MAGLADGVAVELAGRAVQGAGSALIAPAALTLLFTIFGATPLELTKALALYGAAAPAGGTAGVFLGGVLTEYASWPSAYREGWAWEGFEESKEGTRTRDIGSCVLRR